VGPATGQEKRETWGKRKEKKKTKGKNKTKREDVGEDTASLRKNTASPRNKAESGWRYLTWRGQRSRSHLEHCCADV